MISHGNGYAPVSGDQTAYVRGAESGVDTPATPEDFEPDLSLDDLTNGRLARIIEETRMKRLLEIDAKGGRRKLERECIASQMRAQMNRDGVVRHVIKGVGKATLLEARPLHQCENCAASIGDGKRDPYLKVEAA